jgi:hypothetical protein
MAKIGAVKLKIDIAGEEATLDVTYNVMFGANDRKAKQLYKEECRIIGDDTNASDGPAAGGDDMLGFLTPLFNKEISSDEDGTIERHFTRTIRRRDLDEDRGDIPNPDEIRALVTLTATTPTAGAPIHRESPMVKVQIV